MNLTIEDLAALNQPRQMEIQPQSARPSEAPSDPLLAVKQQPDGASRVYFKAGMKVRGAPVRNRNRRA